MGNRRNGSRIQGERGVTRSSWQRADVANMFLDERRAAIPYGVDQVQIAVRAIHHFGVRPTRFIDLGCGDGYLARVILSHFPHAEAILIDHSPAMLQRARAAMQPYRAVRIIEGDLADSLLTWVEPESVELVIAGYSIHHLPHERKRSLYEEIFTVLKPGGMFLNIEHVASASPEIERLWDDVFIDLIAERTGKPREEAAHEYHTRPDKQDNILLPVDVQVRWLREIGFAHADCLFRFLELAVFGGVKPRGRGYPNSREARS